MKAAARLLATAFPIKNNAAGRVLSPLVLPAGREAIGGGLARPCHSGWRNTNANKMAFQRALGGSAGVTQTSVNIVVCNHLTLGQQAQRDHTERKNMTAKAQCHVSFASPPSRLLYPMQSSLQ